MLIILAVELFTALNTVPAVNLENPCVPLAHAYRT